MGTKTAIKKEFMKEYAHKSLESITIKELCFNTPVARTTFYNYYHNMDELTTKELYELLKARAEIFVVEQNCVYQDLDGLLKSFFMPHLHSF